MRMSRLLAAAAFLALPLGVSAANATPASPAAAKTAIGADATAPLVKVAKRGGRGMRSGGFRGRGPGMGRAFRGRGPGVNRRAFRRGSAGFRRGAARRHQVGHRSWRHRHWRHRHHHHRRWWRGGVYFGAPYYYGSWGPSFYDDYFYDDPVIVDEPVASYDDDAVERCDARYRSFDRSTGTFMTYGGERKLCPYLR